MPQETVDEATRLIAQYSTAFILDNSLVGSGTFIRCGEMHGILTAHHVPHNAKDHSKKFDCSPGSKQSLGIIVADFAHRFEIKMQYLEVLDVGVPESEESGPDISVVILPNTNLGEIKARKAFYDIAFKRDLKLAKAITDEGLWVVCGVPAEFQKEEFTSSGFDKVIVLPGICGCTGVEKRFERGSFDYVDVGVKYTSTNNQPHSFGGCSGGGLWKTQLTEKADAKIICGEPVLAGVLFYQSPTENNFKHIRAHGGKTVYDRVFKVLEAHPRFGIK